MLIIIVGISNDIVKNYLQYYYWISELHSLFVSLIKRCSVLIGYVIGRQTRGSQSLYS